MEEWTRTATLAIMLVIANCGVLIVASFAVNQSYNNETTSCSNNDSDGNNDDSIRITITYDCW